MTKTRKCIWTFCCVLVLGYILLPTKTYIYVDHLFETTYKGKQTSIPPKKYHLENKTNSINVAGTREKLFLHTKTTTSMPSNTSLVPHIQIGHKDLLKFYEALLKKSSSKLPRLLDQSQYQSMIHLISVFVEASKDYNISWMMYYGTLLGSYITHDILPWDDDVDLLIEQSGMTLLEKLQNNGTLQEKYQLKYLCKHNICKVFFPEKPNMGKFNRSWKWPYLDLVPYKTEGPSIKCLDTLKPGHKFTLPIDWALPTNLRPLGPLWLPAPRDPWRMMSVTYQKNKVFKCMYGFWNHLHEHYRRKTLGNPTINCSDLQDTYPFVWRQAEGNMTEETLRDKDKPVYTLLMDEPYYSQAETFRWTFLQPSSLYSNV